MTFVYSIVIICLVVLFGGLLWKFLNLFSSEKTIEEIKERSLSEYVLYCKHNDPKGGFIVPDGNRGFKPRDGVWYTLRTLQKRKEQGINDDQYRYNRRS